MKPNSLENTRGADSPPEVSVVVPLYNEAENVLPLYEALRTAMVELGRTWEAIFIDDGSTDSTYRVLEQLHLREEGVRVVRLRRNFGQTAAMAAGFSEAQGEIIVTMDGDLQNDPADITLLIAKLEQGYDLASGWRINRKDPYLNRRLPSKIANWLISFITGVHLHDYGCTLKALRRDYAKELKLYGEMHRFIPALVANLGAGIVEVPVHHHPRRNGHSKYGLTRTIRVVLDLMTVKFLSGYSTRPGHLFGLLGILALLVGSSITFYLGFQRIAFQTSLADRPILLLGMLLIITGVQSISMGLLGEMLSRTYHESQRKPVYMVKEVLSKEKLDTASPVERRAFYSVSGQK